MDASVTLAAAATACCVVLAIAAVFVLLSLPSPPQTCYSRRLWGFERVYVAAGEVGGSKVLVAVSLEVPDGILPVADGHATESLRAAAAHVIQRQPMLAAELVVRGDESWLAASTQPGEVDVAEVDDIERAIAEALSSPFSTLPAPQHGSGARRICTVALRYAVGPDRRVSVLLQLHHAICDGVSAIDGVMAPILAAWKDRVTGGSPRGPDHIDGTSTDALPMQLAPALPQLARAAFFRRAAACFAVARSIYAEIALPRFACIAAFAVPHVSLGPPVTRVLWRQLDAERVAACRAACRAHGITFNSLLHAALAHAAERTGAVPAHTPLLLRCSVSLRLAQSPALPSTQVGYCVGNARSWLTVPSTGGDASLLAALWSTAAVDASQSALADRSPAAHAAWALAKEILTPVLLGRARADRDGGRRAKPPKPPATLLTSNVGDRSRAFAGLQGGHVRCQWRVVGLRFCSSVAAWRALEVTAVTCGEGGCGLGFAAPSWLRRGGPHVDAAAEAAAASADAAALWAQESIADEAIRILRCVGGAHATRLE